MQLFAIVREGRDETGEHTLQASQSKSNIKTRCSTDLYCSCIPVLYTTETVGTRLLRDECSHNTFTVTATPRQHQLSAMLDFH